MALKNASGNYLKVNLGASRLEQFVACDLYASESVRRDGPGEFDAVAMRSFPCASQLAAQLDAVPVLAEGQTLRQAIVAAQYAAMKASGAVDGWIDC